MLKHIKKISLMTLLCFITVLCGCGQQEVQEVIDNKYAEYMANQFKTCAQVYDLKGIDTVCDEINSCEVFADKYNSISLIADIIEGYVNRNSDDFYDVAKYSLDKLTVICTADSSVKGKIEAIYTQLLEKMNDALYDYLTGVWERADESGFAGGRVKVNWVEDEDGNTHFIGEIIKVPTNNDFGFEKGEVKWHSFIIKNNETFYFYDLIHTKSGASYEMAEATVKKEDNTILVQYTDSFSSANGRVQEWKKIK